MSDNVVSSTINSIVPSSESLKDDMAKGIEILKDACESKMNLLEADIQKDYIRNDDTYNLPIVSVIRKTSKFYCVKEDGVTSIAEDLANAISNLVEHFTTGDLLKVIAKGLTEALGIFLGTSNGSINENKQLTVFVENDTMVRYDSRICHYDLKGSALKTSHENYVIIILYKAVIDIKKVPFNTFLYYYDRYDGTRYFKADDSNNDPTEKVKSNNIDTTTKDDRNAIIDEQDNFINRLKACWKIYTLLGGPDPIPDIISK